MTGLLSTGPSDDLPAAAANLLHRAMEDGDVQALNAALHDDVNFYSPASVEPTVGRERVAKVLATAGQIYGGMAVEQLITEGPTGALFFRVDIDGLTLQVCYRLEVETDGRITRLDALMRPLQAAEALVVRMMRQLEEPGRA